MPTTWNALYLGVNPIIDPTEGNTTAENAGALVGQTFGGSGSALANEETTVTTIDRGGASGALDQNQGAGGSSDRMTYNIGAGSVTTTFDAAAQYNVTIDYVGGQPSWTGTAVVAQDTLGNTFLVPQINAGAEQTALVAAPIWSVTINSTVGTSFSGLATNRQATNFLACFAEGTLIQTPQGRRRIDWLRAGDLVLTKDHGAQPLRWIGRSRVAAMDRHAPVIIGAGRFGNGRKLVVSPQHRMLIRGPEVELIMGEAEALVAAHLLVGMPDVTRQPTAVMTYLHLLFDRHEVIKAEGAWTESLFLGDMVRKSGLVPDADEVAALFPDLATRTNVHAHTARPVLTRAEMRLLERSLELAA